MDDRAAISRLYPVTEENIAEFSGKTLFAENTARVRGQVRFVEGQGMQGVNVVARLVDDDEQPSSSVAASSVSSGLAGKPGIRPPAQRSAAGR